MSELSIREQEVKSLLIKGLSYKEIAGQLGISLSTTKIHCSRVLQKTKCNSRIHLAVQHRSEIDADSSVRQLFDTFTETETSVFRAILNGRNDKQIAMQWKYSRVWITHIVHSVAKKLKTTSRARAVYVALANGFKLEGGQ
jgi:DNA-binding NarL/FixJ family response regulator